MASRDPADFLSEFISTLEPEQSVAGCGRAARGELQLVVCENGRRWIEHVRARMTVLGIGVCHRTSPECCREALDGRGRFLVLLELGSQPIRALKLLEELNGRGYDATVVVLAGMAQRFLELVTRELGAVEFLVEPVASRTLAEILHRIARAMLAGGRLEKEVRWRVPNQSPSQPDLG